MQYNEHLLFFFFFLLLLLLALSGGFSLSSLLFDLRQLISAPVWLLFFVLTQQTST